VSCTDSDALKCLRVHQLVVREPICETKEALRREERCPNPILLSGAETRA
jgi:hypothetical protein